MLYGSLMKNKCLLMRVFRAILLISLFCVNIYAENIYDILVNDDFSSRDQTTPRIAVDRSGDFVIAWMDKRNNRVNIYCQFYNKLGEPQGVNRKLNDDAINTMHFQPAVAANNLDQFAAVWTDYRNGSYPFGPDIYYTLIDTISVPANINVTEAAPDSLRETPDVAVLSGGTFVTVWADYRNRQWDIYGQRFTLSGVMLGGNFKINSDIGINQQHSPRVDATASGGFTVVWYDNRSTAGDDNIYAQRFDSDAVAIGDNFQINDDNTEARQAFPVIAADGYGQFNVAWVDWQSGVYPNNPDIYLRRYNSAGNPIGNSVIIADHDSPQRDVAICSDILGNICVAWADSSMGQWDSRARIIDNSGVMEPFDFLIHDSTVNKQLAPDVSSDGYNLYFTWADNRSGNFDIYASIIEFNNPTIIINPIELEFSMDQGGALPAGQSVSLENAGFGELNWKIAPSAGWLTVAPDSGRTPATVQFSINDASLTYGTYFGQAQVINIDLHDSSTIIPVKLTVNAPVIELTPDTVEFRVLAELGDPDPENLAITNAGIGSISWTAEENSSWVNLDKLSGDAPDYISISLSITGLEYGHHYEPLIISSNEAANSPETAWVHLELAGDMPYIEPDPDSLEFRGVAGDLLQQTVMITNPGAGSLNWIAVEAASWLSLDIESGTDDDVITVTANTSSLTSGYYSTDIIINDNASFNQTVNIPVEVFLSCGDTVNFINANTMPGLDAMMPIFIKLSRPSKGGYIPIGADSNLTPIDSIVINPATMPSFIDFYESVTNAGEAEIGFRVSDICLADSFVTPGNYYIGSIHFSSIDSNLLSIVDTIHTDSSGSYILDTFLIKGIPEIKAGSLFVGTPTPVEDYDPPLIADNFTLKQNYPNPFNSATTIEFSIPRRSSVKLSIYNILGQDVNEIEYGMLSAGEYVYIWDGRLGSGKAAPSGIYFYRIKADNIHQVRKMVLLK